jgi:hypothetical protein
MKQETLEEASWKYNPLKKLDGEFIRAAFINGAKWQQERMYSEEELQDEIAKLKAENEKLKLRLSVVSQHSELLKEIFSITAGTWDDPVISEDLYNRMEAAISFNCG